MSEEPSLVERDWDSVRLPTFQHIDNLEDEHGRKKSLAESELHLIVGERQEQKGSPVVLSASNQSAPTSPAADDTVSSSELYIDAETTSLPIDQATSPLQHDRLHSPVAVDARLVEPLALAVRAADALDQADTKERPSSPPMIAATQLLQRRRKSVIKSSSSSAASSRRNSAAIDDVDVQSIECPPAPPGTPLANAQAPPAEEGSAVEASGLLATPASPPAVQRVSSVEKGKSEPIPTGQDRAMSIFSALSSSTATNDTATPSVAASASASVMTLHSRMEDAKLASGAVKKENYLPISPAPSAFSPVPQEELKHSVMSDLSEEDEETEELTPKAIQPLVLPPSPTLSTSSSTSMEDIILAAKEAQAKQTPEAMQPLRVDTTQPAVPNQILLSASASRPPSPVPIVEAPVVQEDETVVVEPKVQEKPTPLVKETEHGAALVAVRRSGSLRHTIHRWSHYVKSGIERYLLSHQTPKPEGERDTRHDMNGANLSWQHAPEGNPLQLSIGKYYRESAFLGTVHYHVFTIKTNRSPLTVDRRYKHFQWLHAQLEKQYAPLILPCLPAKPEKPALSTGLPEQNPIEIRRALLEMYLRRVARHPILGQSEVFQQFLFCHDPVEWRAQRHALAKAGEKTGTSWLEDVVVTAPNPLGVETETFVRHFKGFVRENNRMVAVLTMALRHFAHSVETFEGAYRKTAIALLETSRPVKTTGINKTVNCVGNWCFHPRCMQCRGLTVSVQHAAVAFQEMANVWGTTGQTTFLPYLYALQEANALSPQLDKLHNIYRHATSQLRTARRMHIAGKLQTSELDHICRKCNVIFHLVLTEMEVWHQQRQDDVMDPLRAFIEGLLTTQRICEKNLESILHEMGDQYRATSSTKRKLAPPPPPPVQHPSVPIISSASSLSSYKPSSSLSASSHGEEEPQEEIVQAAAVRQVLHQLETKSFPSLAASGNQKEADALRVQAHQPQTIALPTPIASPVSPTAHHHKEAPPVFTRQIII